MPQYIAIIRFEKEDEDNESFYKFVMDLEDKLKRFFQWRDCRFKEILDVRKEGL